jgi:hypothetical protein
MAENHRLFVPLLARLCGLTALVAVHWHGRRSGGGPITTPDEPPQASVARKAKIPTARGFLALVPELSTRDVPCVPAYRGDGGPRGLLAGVLTFRVNLREHTSHRRLDPMISYDS